MTGMLLVSVATVLGAGVLLRQLFTWCTRRGVTQGRLYRIRKLHLFIVSNCAWLMAMTVNDFTCANYCPERRMSVCDNDSSSTSWMDRHPLLVQWGGWSCAFLVAIVASVSFRPSDSWSALCCSRHPAAFAASERYDTVGHTDERPLSTPRLLSTVLLQTFVFASALRLRSSSLATVHKAADPTDSRPDSEVIGSTLWLVVCFVSTLHLLLEYIGVKLEALTAEAIRIHGARGARSTLPESAEALLCPDSAEHEFNMDDRVVGQLLARYHMFDQVYYAYTVMEGLLIGTLFCDWAYSFAPLWLYDNWILDSCATSDPPDPACGFARVHPWIFAGLCVCCALLATLMFLGIHSFGRMEDETQILERLQSCPRCISRDEEIGRLRERIRAIEASIPSDCA